MPRKEINYSKTIIYKIRCEDENITDIYVGSTTNFIKRKNIHKIICNNENCQGHNLKIYKTIRESGGWEKWKMIQVEEYESNNKQQAEEREEYWRKELKAELNMKRAFITDEQHKEYNKNYNKDYREKNKEYYQKNAEKIKAYNKEYYQKNKKIKLNKIKLKLN